MPPLPPHISDERVLECLEEMEPGTYTLDVVTLGMPPLVMEGGFYFEYRDKVYSFGSQPHGGARDKTAEAMRRAGEHIKRDGYGDGRVKR